MFLARGVYEVGKTYELYSVITIKSAEAVPAYVPFVQKQLQGENFRCICLQIFSSRAHS